MMLAVNPDTAHRVVNGREDLHRNLPRILSDKVTVHLKNTAELALQIISRDMRQIEVHPVRIMHAEPHVNNDLINGPGSDITRYEVSVCRIHILKEIPALFLMRLRIFTVNPYTSAFAAACLRHQAVFVRTRDRRRMNLQELRIAELCALLIHSRYCRAVADRGRRAAAIYLTRAACRQNDDIRREGNDLVGIHILCDDSAADTVFILDDPDEFPELILLDAALDFPAANLLVQCIEKLLARRRTGKYRALILLTAEIAQIQHAFCRAGERHAHPVKHLDELRRCFDHALYRKLIGQEVAAIYRIVEVLVDGIMLALRVHAGVDAALRAQGM